MVFKLKMTVGVDFIMNKEEMFREKFITKFQSNRNITFTINLSRTHVSNVENLVDIKKCN